MLSLRVSNPGLRVVAVADEASARAIKLARHRLLEICDELVPVPTPPGDGTFRNRWIKTQLDQFIPGSVLYLDSDTLVRKPLVELPRLVSELGAAANHNGATLEQQIWSEDAAACGKMGWPANFRVYVNGGVFFFKPCVPVREFFGKWHELWLSCVSSHGWMRDQPAVSRAVELSRVNLQVLPPVFNAQPAVSWEYVTEAVVWHFHSSSGVKFSFDHLVSKSRQTDLNHLTKLVSTAIKSTAPWPNRDLVARWLARKVAANGKPKPSEVYWLTGKRLLALRVIGGVVKRYVLGK
jgi:hypothetical protein